MSHQAFPRRSQQGVSLLEAIAFLGIAAVVILGAIALLNNGFSSANSNRAQEEVSAIRTGVKRLYMGQASSYGTSNMNATLISANVFPSTLATDAASGSVLNSWNGDVQVVGATATFLISYASVPKDVCINLVSANSDWLAVTVNGGGALALPVTPAAAETACNAAANTIQWTAN